jgi:hypothetical protein
MIREKTDCEEHRAHCLEVPELERLQYFFGQMLGPEDFRAEQTFFREKLKLHNRCLHGYGTVCGLEVVPVPMPEDCDPPGPSARGELENELQQLQQVLETSRFSDPDEVRKIQERMEEIRRRLRCLPQEAGRPAPRTRVLVRCGLAYDCAGNELIVRRDLPVDLLAHLPPQEARGLGPDAPVTLWLSLCHCEQPTGPVRPVLPDACGAAADCVFGKVRDAVRVRVALQPPEADERCETCCSSCEDCCVLLAKIDGFTPGRSLTPEQIDNGVRRPLGVYVPTRIAGVSWSHGAEYTETEVEEMTRDKGLEIRFTRPVLVSTIQPGVVDLWTVEGGRGRRGLITNMDGVYKGLPASGTIDRLIYQYVGDDSPSPGDRLLVVVRANFLLDACCRPVDGENVGGRVPILADYETYRRGADGPQDCPRPFGSFGPWQSGNGTPGGTFESWFYVAGGKR